VPSWPRTDLAVMQALFGKVFDNSSVAFATPTFLNDRIVPI